MTRGPKPKPAHLKLLEGNPGMRRVPVGEPRPPIGPVPQAPEFLTGDARVLVSRSVRMVDLSQGI
jgi:hypothetical protein